MTGGAGYIGAMLCDYLLGAGHQVIVLDNFRHGVPSLSHLFARGLKIVRGDVRVTCVVKAAIAGADVVIPLAGIVGARQCDEDPVAAETTNTMAVKSIMLLKDKDQRVLFPNTNSGYGTSGEPVCTEESELKPISLYGRTKHDAERLVMIAPNSTVFRLATAFGMSSRMRWSLLVNQFCFRAIHERSIVLFEPEARRNYVHVRDVARAFVWAIENPALTAGQVFNLGLDEANMTKRQLAEKIAIHTEFYITDAPFASDPDKRDYYVSSQKLYSTGFKPTCGVDEGIKEVLSGARQFSSLD